MKRADGRTSSGQIFEKISTTLQPILSFDQFASTLARSPPQIYYSNQILQENNSFHPEISPYFSKSAPLFAGNPILG